MAVLTLLRFPDERLRRVAVPVEKVDDEIRTLIDDMIETMYAERGIGLAAPQVNVSKRIVLKTEINRLHLSILKLSALKMK